MFKRILLLSLLFSLTNVFAVPAKIKLTDTKNDKQNPEFSERKDNSLILKMDDSQKNLLDRYARELPKIEIEKLKKDTISMAQKSVPVLITVMKGKDYPDNSRWMATFLLGRIMGRKSAKYISKFTSHPNWMLRVAALKVLVALDQKQFVSIYARALRDKSMLVRVQGLESIRQLKLSVLTPNVWKMLFDDSNYIGDKGNRKRTDVVRQAIRTVAYLDYPKSRMALLTLAKSQKYTDVFGDVDWALSQILKVQSPEGSVSLKRAFWERAARPKSKS